MFAIFCSIELRRNKRLLSAKGLYLVNYIEILTKNHGMWAVQSLNFSGGWFHMGWKKMVSPRQKTPWEKPVEDIFSYHAAMSSCLRAKEWHRCIELFISTMRLEVRRVWFFHQEKNPRVMRVDGWGLMDEGWWGLMDEIRIRLSSWRTGST